MKYYCSTGTFIGRVNGRNFRFITQYGPSIRCDGLEFMMNDDWYDKLPEILPALRGSGLRFPVLHADKRSGDMISSLVDEELDRLFDMWKRNLEAGAYLGCEKLVCHIWGRPDSDAQPMRIFERVGRLRELTKTYGIDFLSENNACIHGSPLAHLREYARLDPSFGVIIDTRAAQFHRELEATVACTELWKNGNIRHVHISDMHGEYKQWDAMYPILAPGAGDIDFPAFFAGLVKNGYDNTITLESPAMFPDRVGVEELNRYLDFIRAGVETAKQNEKESHTL